MEIEHRNTLVTELASLIQKGNAHVTFTDAVADLPPAHRSLIPENLPYSIWQLVEHMRIAQHDILDFSISENYEELDWPKDYWTAHIADVSYEQWNASLATIDADQKAFIRLLENKDSDLFTPFYWGNGQNLLREAILIGDHNAYHTAEIIVIRRLLGNWQ